MICVLRVESISGLVGLRLEGSKQLTRSMVQSPAVPCVEGG